MLKKRICMLIDYIFLKLSLLNFFSFGQMPVIHWKSCAEKDNKKDSFYFLKCEVYFLTSLIWKWLLSVTNHSGRKGTVYGFRA